MITDHKTCFQFKASFSPCTILQITHYDLGLLEDQIPLTIARAPNIFLGSPLVIDLEKIQSHGEIDFSKLKQLLIKVGLAPMGIRGGTLEHSTAAAAVGLPLVNIGKTATTFKYTNPDKPDEKDKSREAEDHLSKKEDKIEAISEIETSQSTEYHLSEISHTVVAKSQTKIVTQPIRSGMQVYAKDADLIIIGQVSSGAELLADGNIHVYGALRGRALAGLSGNTFARIFCRTLEAELVSIAGFYLTKEDIQALPAHNGMIQIYLENEQVKIEAL